MKLSFCFSASGLLAFFAAGAFFCFFAEDTDIFHGSYKFTSTVERMTSEMNAARVQLLEALGGPWRVLYTRCSALERANHRIDRQLEQARQAKKAVEEAKAAVPPPEVRELQAVAAAARQPAG